MPTIKLIKAAVDTLRPRSADAVYWESTLPGFGVKVTPKGRKISLRCTEGRAAKPRLRKYTIGPCGRVTLHQARAVAQRRLRYWWLLSNHSCLRIDDSSRGGVERRDLNLAGVSFQSKSGLDLLTSRLTGFDPRADVRAAGFPQRSEPLT